MVMSGEGIKRKSEELTNQLQALVRRYLFQDKARGPGDEVALTRQEIRAIIALGERPSWTMGELAANLVLAMGSLTVIVDRLVTKGLATRQRSEKDRRVVDVSLTAAGRERYAERRRRRLRMARAMLEALDEAEQDAFLSLMQKIRDRAVGPVDGAPR
jgi:DNA-binding MarR family transcriptional regulator